MYSSESLRRTGRICPKRVSLRGSSFRGTFELPRSDGMRSVLERGVRALWVSLVLALLFASQSAAGRSGDRAVAPCTQISFAAGKLLRPTQGGPFKYSRAEERPLRGKRVAVHWVGSGRDAPPLADRDHNQIPDYVQTVRDVADRALAFYETPRALPDENGDIKREDVTKRLDGFRPPPCDSAGPNRLPDIYIASTGAPGRAFAPSTTVDGAFVLISNGLRSVRPTEPPVYGSLQGTVAHEVFHLVQYAYIPEG